MVIWDQDFKQTRNYIKKTVVDSFNLISPQTVQQQHMAFSEILLLHSLTAGLTETQGGWVPCKGYNTSASWTEGKNGGKAKLWSQFPPGIALGSQGLALGMDPSYRNNK